MSHGSAHDGRWALGSFLLAAACLPLLWVLVTLVAALGDLAGLSSGPAALILVVLVQSAVIGAIIGVVVWLPARPGSVPRSGWLGLAALPAVLLVVGAVQALRGLPGHRQILGYLAVVMTLAIGVALLVSRLLESRMVKRKAARSA